MWRELRKAIWLCLIWALHVTHDEAQTAELQAATDYVSCKARLLAESCVTLLNKHVTDSPLPILLPLLSCALNKLAGEDDAIQGVIVSHGRSTASSIAGIANQLTGGYYFNAFDMPWATSTRDIIDLLIAHLAALKQGAGLIILVDMGSLKEIYEEIKLHLHGELLVINNVSTAMALDIAGKIQSQLPMEEIIEGVKGPMKSRPAITQAYFPAIKSSSPASRGRDIAQAERYFKPLRPGKRSTSSPWNTTI